MTEISFAKQFLATLDARPVRLSPDHVEDPKNSPLRAAYILPKMSRPMSKPSQNTNTTTTSSSSSAAAGPATTPTTTTTAPGYTVTVKSLRNPPVDVTLPAQGPDTSVLDVKAAVAQACGVPTPHAADRLRLLHRRKPVADSKVLRELAGKGETAVEFSVMVIGGGGGGAAAQATAGEAQKDVAQGQSGAEVLATKEFWDDLRGFLLQRVRDEKTAGDLTDTFQSAWKAKR
ncbi:cell-cycle control medial ring component-domain-containing protein [Xylariaceae sp. FL0804]|nr:cell-cycle control medial ring component-domain-containing protein [Xylariaceae sp. FL0804]